MEFEMKVVQVLQKACL